MPSSVTTVTENLTLPSNTSKKYNGISFLPKVCMFKFFSPPFISLNILFSHSNHMQDHKRRKERAAKMNKVDQKEIDDMKDMEIQVKWCN